MQDWWIETEEWFIAPDGEMSAYAGDNVGPEQEFARLDAGKYTAALSRLDPAAARGSGAATEVDVDLRWMAGDERTQTLNRLQGL